MTDEEEFLIQREHDEETLILARKIDLVCATNPTIIVYNALIMMLASLLAHYGKKELTELTAKVQADIVTTLKAPSITGAGQTFQ